MLGKVRRRERKLRQSLCVMQWNLHGGALADFGRGQDVNAIF